ncbi:glucosaminidase domain-containing protein, partial [Hydrogenivirga sp. 128-5-R1-1]|uniref:glucosaminidase domain-containing protein n=1 Tax=Hydrogenivirga sp. 128-5-R1-1 TaxID=392423 RepID=UPI00015F1F92
AQAAIESGWGTSRFFVEANNIFGMWSFNKKNSLKIKAKKSNVYLKKYPDILASIEDYYYSINVSWAYKNFRYVRLTTKDSLKLANHLEKYSILRKTYVKRIKTIIQHNNLTYYDSCRLHPDYIGR